MFALISVAVYRVFQLMPLVVLNCGDLNIFCI